MKKLVNGEIVDLTEWEIADLAERQAAAQADAATELQNAILDATQAMLDDFARTRLYDGIMSACTYVSSTNPVFAGEGQYCVELRDRTWAKLYEMLAEVQAGTRPIPSSFEDMASELPVSSAKWP